ncbi:hypothetical protein [Arthrobacter sp. FW306-05-C]|nr:hypothetical protein [Arthrobacter sp. FW306-05-C]
MPRKPPTDAELTAIINGVGTSRNLPFPALASFFNAVFSRAGK